MECSFLTTFVAMTTEESVVRRKPSETSRKTAAKTDTKSRITTPTGTLDKNGLPSYDSRHPNYVGFWKRSIPNIDDTIAIDDIDEPHIKRRHAMLAAHPDIKTLYGIEPSTKYVIATIVSVQLALAYYFGQVWSTGQTGKGFMLALIVCAFVIGGTITQLIGVIIHEATHGLIFESPIMNKIAGIVSNLALPVPIAQSFRRYHLEHHAFQGVVGKDPDLPLDFEVKLIKVTKLLCNIGVDSSIS